MTQELDLANLRTLTEAGTPLAQPTVLALFDSLSEESARANRASEAVNKQSEIFEQPTARSLAAEAKLSRVTAVHTPTNALMNPGRNERVVEVCTGCGTDDGNWQIYPCPTIRALDRGAA